MAGAGRMACGHVTKEAWRGWALTWSMRVSWRRREVVPLAWAREDSHSSEERIGQAGAAVMDAVGDASLCCWGEWIGAERREAGSAER
jgi:hypothetical protein